MDVPLDPTSEEMREQFHNVLAPFVAALRDYVRSALGRPVIQAADSRAMAELAGQKAFSVVEWSEPARNAHSYGLILCHHLLDHLGAYAAVAEGSVFGPSFSHRTLVRAVMEVAPIACWLCEPHIGAAKRIKRSQIWLRESANSLGRNQHVPSAVAAADRLRARVDGYVASQGWTWVTYPRRPQGIDDERYPDPEDFGIIAFGSADAGASRGLWNYLSAQSHGTMYAVISELFRIDDGPHDPLDPTGETRAIGAETDDVIKFGVVCLLGVQAAIDRRDQLMGWEPPPEYGEASERARDLARPTIDRLIEDVERTGRTEY